METFSHKKFTLNNGTNMPAIGFGTFRIRQGDVLMESVEWALQAGYRMFDTAAVYGNERHLRQAFNMLLPKFGLEREDVFITTKLSPRDTRGKDSVVKAFKKSLDLLGLETVDLYLIHFPGMSGMDVTDTRNIDLRDKTWEALVKCYDDGMAKAIGVSNYTVRHLKELQRNNHGVTPAVNQVECHPYFPQQHLLDYCKHNDIILQAYCSLGGTSAGTATLLHDPIVVEIASKLKVTSSQLLLRWAAQQDIAIIPKSTHCDRIKENISLDFIIPDEDMVALTKLGESSVKYAWDPETVV